MRKLMAASLLMTAAGFVQAQTEGLTVEKLVNLNKLHDVVVSPNGDQLVYGLKTPDNNHLYLMPTNQLGSSVQLTSSEKSESNVVWAPDGSALYFLSSRSGSSQIWQLPLKGGEARQISDLPLEVEGFKLAPNGQNFVLSLSVFPECEDLECSAKKLKAEKEVKSTGRVYEQLFVRHWDTWLPKTKRHLFSAQLGSNGKLGQTVDLMPGWQTDSPARPFSGMEEVSFTADSQRVVFAAKKPAKDHSWQTNFDLFQSDLSGNHHKNLTYKNLALDSQPTFSPDGRFMAHMAMKKPGFEADRLGVVLTELKSGRSREVAKNWDRSASSLLFSADGKTLYVTAADLGQKSVFAITLANDQVTKLYSDGYAGDLQLAGQDLIFTRSALDAPKDIYKLSLQTQTTQALTAVNQQKLNAVKFGEFEQFSFAGWNDEVVHGYWIKPSNYQEGKKYPIAFLIHGGPQGSFGNGFHFRWNAQLWAAQGYGIVMVDFHGSTGYGQAFTDSISRDWGGKPLEDLKKGMAAVTQQQPWLDAENTCALGGSYGGYMVNWIAGNWSDGFNCLVNHAGLYDLPGFYATTEELWFAEHEWGGPVWSKTEDYTKFNPANYVENWKTPMLVIHGEKDFRVPYDQGLAAFTTLQRRNIPSRLLMFPDENHWVLNPDNLKQWYAEVFRWMDEWL